MPSTPRRGDPRPLAAVCEEIGFSDGFAGRSSTKTARVEAAVTWLSKERPQQQNHWPALALALVAQIEALFELEGVESVADVLASHPPETASGGRAVNTLNLTRSDGEPVRLRSLYNDALNVIRNIMLREHPQNPGHATQSWPQYRPLIQAIGQMDGGERRAFAEAVWDEGVLRKPAREIAAVQERAIRPFEYVLRNMPTQVQGIRGGALLQALAFGYLNADSPNLILESHSVNVGASRAKMLGDVDGFRGKEPELAAEVKDVHVSAGDAEEILSDFLEDIVAAPNATAIVICTSVDEAARSAIESRGITVLSRDDLVRTVGVWDLPKQEEALRGVEYYLGRIQKSAKAVQFLRDWLESEGIDAGLGVTGPADPDEVE